MSKEDISKAIIVKRKEMLQWIDQIVPITIDMRRSALNQDWGQVEHFGNLIRQNVTYINNLAQGIEANKRELENADE